MNNTWHQQVFALDIKYSSQRMPNHPSEGLNYMRRRSELLEEKICKNILLKEHYLKIRAELFRRRYGTYLEASNSPSENSIDIKSKTILVPKSATTEGIAGVHHVFDQHTDAISMLKFANNEKSKFCCASFDGTISICEALGKPPKVVALLRGHGKAVTAIDWSISNDLLVSCSRDTTIRLWKVHADAKPDCLRVVLDQLRAECLCCVFVPTNNNLVISGNSQGLLQVLNVSTGKFIKGGSSKMNGKITSLTCQESGGSLVWAGNDRGMIFSFRLEIRTGRLQKLKRMEGAGGMVTSLSWRPWLTKNFPWPTLLVSACCNAVLLFQVVDDQGYLKLWKKYPIRHKQYSIKSTFSPQIGKSLIATGSEDGSIFLLDCMKFDKSAITNRLLGHSAPALTLAYNYDESLLGTADSKGLVILWKTS